MIYRNKISVANNKTEKEMQTQSNKNFKSRRDFMEDGKKPDMKYFVKFNFYVFFSLS